MFKYMKLFDGLHADIILSFFFCKINIFVPTIITQISLLEECGFLERALEELRRKESKIVCMLYLPW